MNNFLKKITSRKFIVTLLTMAGGIAIAFKESDNEALKSVGCIIAGVAAIVYMIVEGTLDVQSIKKAIQEILSGIEFPDDHKHLEDSSSKESGETNEEKSE